jgi:carbon storage regulator
MLVLSRKINQKIVIGDNITVTVVRLGGGRVGLGIEAPKEIKVLRSELREPTNGESKEKEKEGADASPTARDQGDRQEGREVQG